MAEETFDELLADLQAIEPDADLQTLGRAIFAYMRERVRMLCRLRDKLQGTEET